MKLIKFTVILGLSLLSVQSFAENRIICARDFTVDYATQRVNSQLLYKEGSISAPTIIKVNETGKDEVVVCVSVNGK